MVIELEAQLEWKLIAEFAALLGSESEPFARASSGLQYQILQRGVDRLPDAAVRSEDKDTVAIQLHSDRGRVWSDLQRSAGLVRWAEGAASEPV